MLNISPNQFKLNKNQQYSFTAKNKQKINKTKQKPGLNKKKLACTLAASAGVAVLAGIIIHKVRQGKLKNVEEIKKPVEKITENITKPIVQTAEEIEKPVEQVTNEISSQISPYKETIQDKFAKNAIKEQHKPIMLITDKQAEQVTENLEKGVKRFFNKDGQEIEGIIFKKGRAIDGDGKPFSGVMKTITNSGKALEIEYGKTGLPEKTSLSGNDGFRLEFLRKYTKLDSDDNKKIFKEVIKKYDSMGLFQGKTRIRKESGKLEFASNFNQSKEINWDRLKNNYLVKDFQKGTLKEYDSNWNFLKSSEIK